MDDRRIMCYDKDLLSWAEQQAAHLRSGNQSDLDFEYLREFLEDVADHEKLAAQQALFGILLRLLKLQQSAVTDSAWTNETTELRYGLLSRIERSPSLMSHVPALFDRAWDQARDAAKKYFDTRSETVAIPRDCLCTLAQAMDVDFLPAGERRKP